MTTPGGDRKPTGPHPTLKEMASAEVAAAAIVHDFTTSDARRGLGPSSPVIRP